MRTYPLTPRELYERLLGWEFKPTYTLMDCTASIGIWTPWVQGIDRYNLARLLLTRCRRPGGHTLAFAMSRYALKVRLED